MEEDKQDKRKDGDDLEDLLTEAAEQTAIRAAMKRKAVEEALLKPSMLKSQRITQCCDIELELHQTMMYADQRFRESEIRSN